MGKEVVIQKSPVLDKWGVRVGDKVVVRKSGLLSLIKILIGKEEPRERFEVAMN